MRTFAVHKALNKGKPKINLFANVKSKTDDTKVTGFSPTNKQTAAPKITIIEEQAKGNTNMLNTPAINVVNLAKGEDSPDSAASVNIFASLPSMKLDVSPENFRCEKSGKLEDRYQILDTIGKGGYGEVKKIKDIITNETRALKVMLKSRCQMTKMIVDEIRILKKLVFLA
jgi:hypothetical protein